MITPFDDFVYLINNVLLGDEPTIEDFILLIGTLVAFVAFVLWCCFPVTVRDAQLPLQYERNKNHPPNQIVKYNRRRHELVQYKF